MHTDSALVLTCSTLEVPLSSDPSARLFSSYGTDWKVQDNGGSRVLVGGFPSYMTRLLHKAALVTGFIIQANTDAAATTQPLKITSATFCA